MVNHMLQNKIQYEYKNLPIPGGGYVTGFLFHPKQKDLLYVRTDIGGTYRFHYDTQKWVSLIPHVTMFDLSETFPLGLAIDPAKPERLFIASGINQEGRNGLLSISEDYGDTFHYEEIPFFVHGNLNGRGTGLRLVISPVDSDKIYFASQRDGLLISEDLGKTWRSVAVCGEKYLTNVWVSDDGQTVVVGTAGVTTKKNDQMRGASLYVSYDAGEHFECMPQPKNHVVHGSKMSGYVAQRYDYDGQYLYVTLANTGARSYVIETGYSCDSGDTLAGRVIRYSFTKEGLIDQYTDITPTIGTSYEKKSDYPFGFSGISSNAGVPGMLVCSTICKDDGDAVFLSRDYGETWSMILYDLTVGKLHFRTSYMKPEFNGGVSILHWLSDIKVNPFNPNEVWFNTGTGVFRSENLLSEDCVFEDYCDGIEETVHLNLYSPTGGKVQLIDILGDLGGFAFESLDQACANSFADAEGNRYITCINADFPDELPETVVVTPRGNWKGKTKGGLILSHDQCRTFKRLQLPYGLSEPIDELLRGIENPNVNSGWVAIGADARTIVWSIVENIDLPVWAVVVSQNGGESFEKTVVYDLFGKEIHEGKMKVMADRVNPEIFYGFGEDSAIYVSLDRAKTFHQKKITGSFPEVEFGLIDCASKTEIRGNAGYEGEFYIAISVFGLWKMKYDRLEDTITMTRLTGEGEFAYRVGIGMSTQEKKYIGAPKCIYICGVINDEYGFFLSEDEGANWSKLNDEKQMFGDINSIEGDSRTAGRFFVASGSLGVLYGEPVKQV